MKTLEEAPNKHTTGWEGEAGKNESASKYSLCSS